MSVTVENIRNFFPGLDADAYDNLYSIFCQESPVKTSQLYTYVLSDPQTGQIKYVGKSKDPEKRLKEHMLDACADVYCDSKARWLGRLKKKGMRPMSIVIANYDCEYDAYCSLIKSGVKLYNEHKPPRTKVAGKPLPEFQEDRA